MSALSGFTNYAAAVALLGGYEVLRLGVTLDTFQPFPDRNLTLNSIYAEVVPAPATLALLAIGLAGMGMRRRKSA